MLIDDKMVVLVDIDGVINDLPEKWDAYLCNKYGERGRSELGVIHYDMHKNYSRLEREEVYEALSNPEFWETVEFKKEAIEYLNNLLREKDIRLVICTSTLIKNVGWKWDKLRKAIPKLSQRDLVVCWDKSLIRGDVLIEDCLENAEKFVGQSILLDASYNKCDEDLAGVHRTKDWDGIYDKVLELREQRKNREENVGNCVPS